MVGFVFRPTPEYDERFARQYRLQASTKMCPYQAEFIFFGALPSTFLLKPLSKSPSVHSSHSQDHCRLHTYRSMQSLPLRLKEKHKETCTHVGTTKNIALSASMQRACERTETSVREACGTPVCEDHTTHVQLLLRMDGSSTSVSNALSHWRVVLPQIF